MSNLTTAQIQEALSQWSQTMPKEFLDPTTNTFDVISFHKIRAYLLGLGENFLEQQSVASLPALFDKAAEALWDDFVWFGPKPPKPQPKRVLRESPPMERPLGPWDASRLRQEQKAEDDKRQQAKQKVIDAAAEAAKKANEDPYPATVYKGGRVDHRQTNELRTAWRKRHPEAK